MILNGGAVLGAGGFGCVYKPVLKCKGKNKTKKNRVSKLMLKQNAISEYNEMNKFSSVLKSIRDSSKYFIVKDLDICKPDKIPTEDLTDFKKCINLTKYGLTKKNVNNNLEKLGLLQITDGGTDLFQYLNKNKLTYDNFKKINELLVKLLKNAILKVNKKKLIHNDIKSMNVLYDGKNIRLIDWGISYFHDNKINRFISNRPISFNLPFSHILFSDIFLEKYSNFLKSYKDFNNELYIFIVNFYSDYLKLVGPGHHQAIMSFLYIITGGSEQECLHIIYTYLYKILFYFTKNREILLNKYYNDVFIHNTDVWGFTYIYIDFLDFKYHYSYKVKIDEAIKKMFRFVFNASYYKIDTKKVIEHLNLLNKLQKKTKKK